MLDQINVQVKEWQKKISLDHCGVGFGEPVRFDRQGVVCSIHVSGWQNFPLANHLTKILKLPVIIDNDANVGALGEARYGAGSGYNSIFYMTLSTGIGGGIILDGKIYRGADCMSGEIGHVMIQPDGLPCRCGSKGCMERYCGGLCGAVENISKEW